MVFYKDCLKHYNNNQDTETVVNGNNGGRGYSRCPWLCRCAPVSSTT